MILDKQVKINISTKTFQYYSDLGYKCQLREPIDIKIEHLQKGTRIKINVRCDVCGLEKELRYTKYIQNTKNFTKLYCCCLKCASNKKKETMLRNYGVEHALQNKNLLEKSKQTCKKNYGVEHPLQKEDLLKKSQNTCLENYGFKNPSQNKNIQQKKIDKSIINWQTSFPMQNIKLQEKAIKTSLINNGVKYPMQNKGFQEKVKETNLKKYGGNSPSCDKEIKNKQKQTCLKKYGVENPMQDPGIFKAQQKSSFKVFRYKDTNLTYQAGYEKYFLELMDKYGFLNELSMGKSYSYIFEDKSHKYYSDYFFRNLTIEIKSTWTYNRNGENEKMGLMNESKWQAVKKEGDKLIILFSKKEIKDYVENLIIR